MRAKVVERENAIALRKAGETIPNIAKQLRVSKASVSLWMRDVGMPEEALAMMRARAAKNRLLAHEARRQMTRDKLKNASREAQNLVSDTSMDSGWALIACALMYWCEGTKSKNDSEFTFTNAEPMTIRGFLGLLRQALPLDESRFRVKMHLHEYHDETNQRKFWSEVTGVPESQFQRTFWKPHTGKSVRLEYPGCIHVRYHDVLLSRKIYATARTFLTSSNVVK